MCVNQGKLDLNNTKGDLQQNPDIKVAVSLEGLNLNSDRQTDFYHTIIQIESRNWGTQKYFMQINSKMASVLLNIAHSLKGG